MAIIVFAGWTRKIALPFIALSFVGWIVYVAGFIEYIKEVKKVDPKFNPANEVQLYPFWVASVVGPVVYILAVIHALLWKQLSGIVGSITAVLSMWYFTALSFGLVSAGIIIRQPASEPEISVEIFTKLWFAGGLIATLGWTGVLALWPWYKADTNCNEYSGV